MTCQSQKGVEKLNYRTRAKILGFLALALVLIPEVGNSQPLSRDHSNVYKAYAFRNSQSTQNALRNLKWLRCLAAKDDSSSGAEVAELPSQDSPEGTITSRGETIHAVIHGYNGAKIPSYLVANFDRIFRMVANYFDLEVGKKKVVVWVMDYQTLQKMNPRSHQTKVAALYAPGFHYFFFCPEFMKEYYIAHELIHYFMDAYMEEAITELAQIVVRQRLSSFALLY